MPRSIGRWFVPTLTHVEEFGGPWRLPTVRLEWNTAEEIYEIRGKKAMRVTFTLELKAEIESFDKKQRDVLIKLMSDAARSLYAKSVLLSGSVSPDMELSVEDRKGKDNIALFVGEKK